MMIRPKLRGTVPYAYPEVSLEENGFVLPGERYIVNDKRKGRRLSFRPPIAVQAVDGGYTFVRPYGSQSGPLITYFVPTQLLTLLFQVT
jgi:hypothetical protein